METRAVSTHISEHNNSIDPRIIDDRETTGLVEELQKVQVDGLRPKRTLKLGANLAPLEKEKLSAFLKENLNVFAWTRSDMVGISPGEMAHRLNTDPAVKPIRQKRRATNA
ncbi:hypothetical protein ACOSQ4_028664 [Xanthoceras sorbifolium]